MQIIHSKLGRWVLRLSITIIIGILIVSALATSGLSADAASGDVQLLQRDLAGLDYMPENGIDSVYGPSTSASVRQFQGDNGLTVDGIAGPQTMSALINKVKQVQRIIKTADDGDYGEKTIAAVKRYQQAAYLEVDGIAGPQTIHAMKIKREVGSESGESKTGGNSTHLPLSDDIRDKIVQAARSQLGVHERGNNCNPYGLCEPWCALFASWTWRQAGIDFSTAASRDFYYYGQSHSTLHTGLSNPRFGDAIIFGTGPQNSSTSRHIGIIERVFPNGQLVSIEGNLGNQVERVGPYLPAERGAYAIVSP